MGKPKSKWKIIITKFLSSSESTESPDLSWMHNMEFSQFSLSGGKLQSLFKWDVFRGNRRTFWGKLHFLQSKVGRSYFCDSYRRWGRNSRQVPTSSRQKNRTWCPALRWVCPQSQTCQSYHFMADTSFKVIKDSFQHRSNIRTLSAYFKEL